MDSLQLNESFWAGVYSSLFAAGVLAITGLVFRTSLRAARDRHARGQKEGRIIESALEESSALAPFAYGVAQARSLRHFLLAVFVAYVGDVLSIIYPLNIACYAIALAFIFQGLRWLYKIERNGLRILSSGHRPDSSTLE